LIQVDDLQVAGQEPLEHRDRPGLERLGSSVWLVVEKTRSYLPAFAPRLAVFIDQEPHQFRNRDRRVRVVQLDRDRIRYGGERAASFKCVARISCKLALTKKYCCLSRSSLPCGVESSG